MRDNRRLVFILAAWTLALLLLGAPQARAQELEPNDSCLAAQDVGTAPLEMSGALGSPDVDFFLFRVNNASGTAIIDLEGESLGDPVLGVFNSDCILLAADDDSGEGLNSRITIATPPDGVLVVAATSYPDFGFTGNGFYSGSYTLRVNGDPNSVAVYGRVADSRTGAGIASAIVTLRRCLDGFCFNFVGQTFTDFDGSFRFDSSFTQLPAGEYMLEIFANNYVFNTFGPFSLAGGEERDLGDILLQPLPFIRSVSGRVIDAVTGDPLPGDAPPFAEVRLNVCLGGFFCIPVRFANTDSEGRFLFVGGTDLPPGIYFISVLADQYEHGFTNNFIIGDQEDLDVGDIRVKSFPVRIYPAKVCDAIPSRGGTCQFSVQIVNGMADRLQGESWSLVNSSFLGASLQTTSFQTGLPRALNLQPGDSTEVPFSFFVPGEVNDGTFICLKTFVARKPHSFNTLGHHDIFCLTKGGDSFRVVPENQKRDAVRKATGQGGNRKQ